MVNAPRTGVPVVTVKVIVAVAEVNPTLAACVAVMVVVPTPVRVTVPTPEALTTDATLGLPLV